MELILTSPKMSTCSIDESAEVLLPTLLVDRSCAEAGAATGCTQEQERGGEVCLQLTSQPTCSKAKADLSIHFLFIACPAFSCKVVKLKTRVLFMLPLLSGCWHGLLLPLHQPAQGTELHLL